ncbi:EcsC family protein [Ruminococcus flavefaciens]|uniref:EcsC family protein n=1 Tax=Ruminococcus flavefaciens TaxID=1265 RepID=A0A315YLR0_RUMFL|nr:EcsC family protein [Ruminococcus flavefaciens]PWJ12606.1 EcsC family protein [Ruminococcus flavefaciens]SSA49086.1 EcsC protein family protein [Ruminococcus flavefaciens]
MKNDKKDVSGILKFLDELYVKSIDGIPKISKPIPELAEDYLRKNPEVDTAIKKMHTNQIKKCTTSGVVNGFGGLITLPVTIPANVGSVLYVQMRMIACTAYMKGYDLKSDQVQTFVYACLAGISINEFVKKFGVNLGRKLTTSAIKKIPGEVLVKINQKVGFRFLTKFGEKGLINLGKMVPVVGAAINGGLDFAETKVIAKRAYSLFADGDLLQITKTESEEND